MGVEGLFKSGPGCHDDGHTTSKPSCYYNTIIMFGDIKLNSIMPKFHSFQNLL
jgi:hypothetical protein